MSVMTIAATDGEARAGTVTTLHGDFPTPAFMPVGTHATVKSLTPAEVREAGAGILLCNGYHLMLRPGVDLVERAGGMHALMRWDGPILTDSGGFQLFSLGDVARINDAGATFVSPYDGDRLRVTPEDVIRNQARLGSDIIMCLDQPVGYGVDALFTAAATARTHLWAERCRAVHPGDGRLLFGIAQGGFDRTLRTESASLIAGLDFDGVAIGGLALGEPPEVMVEMASLSIAELPAGVPRYVMGLGTDNELLTMVSLGVDMFDCVLPTRLARNGTALTESGRMPLRRAEFESDLRVVEEGCGCAACAGGFSRAYLRHLFHAGEILGHRLLSIHNVTHLTSLMAGAREAIMAGTFAGYRAAVTRRLPVRKPAGPAS